MRNKTHFTKKMLLFSPQLEYTVRSFTRLQQKQHVSRTITTNSPSSLKEGRMMQARAHAKIMAAVAFIQSLSLSSCATF